MTDVAPASCRQSGPARRRRYTAVRFSAPSLLLAVMLCAPTTPSPAGEGDCAIGYLYPAGGRQGTSVQVTAGGQFLRGASGVNISGAGVTVLSVKHVPPLSPMQLQELGRRLAEIRARLTGMGGFGRAGAAKKEAPAKTKAEAADKKTEPAKPVELPPDHPWVKNLDKITLPELKAIANVLMVLRKQPPKRSIAELAVIELRIAPDAPPGDRELRVETPAGLTNPMRFQVGTFPEIREQEPNDPGSPEAAAVDAPVLINGQIMPGDVDRFRFRARRGQRLVIEAQARQLIPYLADAVPGWFQAVLTLYDFRGAEVAYADDYRTGPDPVIFYEVPQDGEYVIEIRDAIFRGREDFVYRLSVADRPFVTQIFPLGGRTGVETTAAISGWNLAQARMPLDTTAGPDSIRQGALRQVNGASNSVSYAVDDLPEAVENEPNDAPQNAERIVLPLTVNGKIGTATIFSTDQHAKMVAVPIFGDVDVFQFAGRANDEIVAEVRARRLGSPLDSLLRLMDASGQVLAWNDDTEDKGTGLNTHHADSYIRFKLPKDGAYFVQLSDAQGHGGEEYAYRLRVERARPDFALRVTPASINVPAGCAVPISVHALRRDGFAGEIQIVLKNAPAGFALSGALIPEGKDSIRMTLTAPLPAAPQRGPGGAGRAPGPGSAGPLPSKPLELRMEGRARVNGQALSRPAVPAEDMMQAFDYRHLVPAEKLLVTATRARMRSPVMELADAGLVNIPPGGSAKVRLKVPPRMTFVKVGLELSDPPKGVTLGEVELGLGHLTFVVKADAKEAKPGYADNLIAEAFAEVETGGTDPKAPKTTRRVSLGYIPAVPFRVLPK